MREKIAELVYNKTKSATWPLWNDFENEVLKETYRLFADIILALIADKVEGETSENPYPRFIRMIDSTPDDHYNAGLYDGFDKGVNTLRSAIAEIFRGGQL